MIPTLRPVWRGEGGPPLLGGLGEDLLEETAFRLGTEGEVGVSFQCKAEGAAAAKTQSVGDVAAGRTCGELVWEVS